MNVVIIVFSSLVPGRPMAPSIDYRRRPPVIDARACDSAHEPHEKA
jgi:hypothetical protein